MCVVCVCVAESGCQQQEAQVQLLERELELHRSSQGPSHRRSNISTQDSSTHPHPSSSSSSSGDFGQTSQSLAGELADCGGVVQEKKVEGGGGGKEKENRVSNSPKRERRSVKLGLGATSFLEEVEREFEKKASQQGPVKNTQTTLFANRPMVHTYLIQIQYCIPSFTDCVFSFCVEWFW